MPSGTAIWALVLSGAGPRRQTRFQLYGVWSHRARKLGEVCNQLPECAGFYLRTKGSSAKSCVLYTDAALKDMVTTESAHHASLPN